ncbi:heme biosynthesis protein HemY [Paracoccus endophyticus]|uniref:heme biosynthesis protein HemY n=1 Tax=Paracoccus endophyticus TaxID=2233774 RepID=UPI000DD6C428|nr:heme biosynthesis HemY N-terminal domain-containing protein [Paracoccus endophyticus]
MLLSLLKIVFFFAVVLAAALGAMRLAETGQALIVQFNGVEYALGPVQAAVAVIVLILAAWLVVQILRLALAFLRFLMGDKTAIDRYFDRSRERKGYQALAEGMLAVASGEGRLAQDKASRAARFLDQPHLTNLLAAQAAEVAGDATRADAVYREMLTDNRTRFVGIRGLMQRQMALGHTDKALKLAEKAYALKPSLPELQDTLLGLQTRAHDWKGARATLKDKRRQGAIPQDLHLRRDAVLALQEASEVLAHGNSISAREAAISANRASPDLVPAAVLAARSYLAQKDTRNASRLLQKAWSAQPHPALAAAYAEIVPDETPAQRMRRFEDLIRQSPTHEESRLLQAELALAAEDFPAARRALGDLAEKHPTVRSLAIMAAVERGEGADDSVVRGWLARAINASRGPQWVCDNCHNIMADWAPVCDSCAGFDTLTWREPPVPLRATTTNGVEMLPLIVGRPEHAEKAFHEADAYAEGTDAPRHLPHPARPSASAPDPGPSGHGAPGPGASAAVPPAPARPRHAPEIANVPPGMVPRESDYAPSMTVTHPDPAPRPSRTAATPAEAATVVTITTVPPHAVDGAGTGNPPVRPDVEPIGASDPAKSA